MAAFAAAGLRVSDGVSIKGMTIGDQIVAGMAKVGTDLDRPYGFEPFDHKQQVDVFIISF